MLKRSRDIGVAFVVTAVLLFSVVGDRALALDNTSNRNAPYLRVGAGARALAMGGAFVGLANDATAAYWNPAGLTWSSEGRWELTGMYTAGMNVDRTHNYLAAARNSSWGAYALQWINAATQDIEQYDAGDNPQGKFNFTDNAIALSLAKRYDIFSVGITGKYLRESIGADVPDDAVNGYALDVGAGLTLTEFARLGVSVQDIASDLGSVDKVDEIPPTLRVGAAVWPLQNLVTALDIEKTRDEEDYKLHAGAEMSVPVSEDVGAALRLGLDNGEFAGGVGFRFRYLRFDYAYVVEPQNFLGENHRFGLSLVFGEEETQGFSERKVADRDGDGVPDKTDACPGQPEDFDGFADTDGCPDPDNDGDGILDIDDDCPNQAEDFDGFQDTDGCPDPDNDGDGILDVNDKCPDVAENFNNFEDTDGCPDEAPVKIPTLAHINFKFGTAEISGADPIPVLDEVARIMKENPSMKVKVTGHTDNIGSEEANNRLSMRRAQTVRDYLVKKGVDSNRFVLEGMGESEPIDTNDTELGRARNRRIEFSIIQG
jgi:outer membrane protein OmpA-like peptidoglycan-associated protein